MATLIRVSLFHGLLELRHARPVAMFHCGLGMAALIWHDGHGERFMALDRDAVVAIGRGSSVQVAIDDPLVSRLHAELVFESARWRVVDLRSHNGTSVNGDLVRGSRALVHGDVVRCGSTRIAFHEPERIHSAGSQPVTADAPPLPVFGSGDLQILRRFQCRYSY